MLNSLSNMLNNGLRSLNTGIVNRFKLFNPWDYVLLGTSALFPFFVETSINPIFISGMTLFTIGAVVLMPRGGRVSTQNYDAPHLTRVSQIINKIFNEYVVNNKPIQLPERIILNDPHSSHISAEALTCSNDEKILKISGNLSQLTDEQLEMLLCHELAHFHYNDPIAQDYTSRIFMTSLVCGLGHINNNFLFSLAFCATQFLISQASNRYREYRADHYATLIHEDDTNGDPHKIKDLNDLIYFLNRDINVEPNHPNNFIDQAACYCLHAYRHPETLKDKIANSCLNLISSHPSPLYRTKR